MSRGAWTSVRAVGSLLALAFSAGIVGLIVIKPDIGFGRGSDNLWSLIGGILILVTLTVGAFATRASVAIPNSSGPNQRLSLLRRRLTERLVLAGAFGVALIGVVIDVPVTASLTPLERWLTRALLWLGLTVVVVALVQPRRSRSEIAVRRALLAAPLSASAAAVVAAVASGGTLLVGGSMTTALLVTGVLALILVPAILVSSAVAELDADHDRASRLIEVITRRPPVVVLVVLANLITIGLVWALGAWLSPQLFLWSWNVAAWVGSLACAALVLAALTAERRFPLRRSDQAPVSQLLGVLIALPIAGLAAVMLAAVLIQTTLIRPLIAVCVVALACATAAITRLVAGPRVRAAVLAGVALVLTGLSGIATPPLPAGAAVSDALQNWSAPESAAAILVLALLFGLLVIGVVVVAIVLRQVRLLLYLAAVAIWIVIAALLTQFSDATLLNVDATLALLLLVLMILWLRRRQSQVDGFEAVMITVVTATVWLLPIAVRCVPEPVNGWLVAGALMAPAASAVWSGVRDRRRTGSAPSSSRDLGLRCLTYGLLASLVWVLGPTAVTVVEGVADALLDYLLLPLALLLILAVNASRTSTSRP